MENRNWKLNSLRTTESRRRKMKAKIFIASLVGAASLGMMQSASAGTWWGGDCNQHGAGSGACIEYNINGDYWNMGGAESAGYQGWINSPHNNTDAPISFTGDGTPFSFSGPTDLSCPLATLHCDLQLKGYVKKDGDWVGIRIIDGTVSGDGLCGNVSFNSFPWHIGDNSMHSGWSDSSGITISGPPPYTGSVGLIGFKVSNPILFPPYLIDIADAHLHNVEFHNDGANPSYFSFNGDLVDSDDNSTGCGIVGELKIDSPVDDINIYDK